MKLLLILLFLLFLLILSFVPYKVVEKYQDTANATANDWGGVPKTCTIKDLEDCEKKVKELNEKNAGSIDQVNASNKACDTRMNQYEKDANERIKTAEDKMNEFIKEGIESGKRANECEASKMKCESKLTAVEPTLQMSREALDKERVKADQCFKDKGRIEGEFEAMKVEHKALQSKCSESMNLVPSLNEALKNAKSQIAQITASHEKLKQQYDDRYETLKQQCVANI